MSLGAAFFGESMFALEPDASKVAFVALVRQLVRWGIPLIDCQVYTQHLAHFGAARVAATALPARAREGARSAHTPRPLAVRRGLTRR